MYIYTYVYVALSPVFAFYGCSWFLLSFSTGLFFRDAHARSVAGKAAIYVLPAKFAEETIFSVLTII